MKKACLRWLLSIIITGTFSSLFAQCPACNVSSGQLVVNGNFSQGNTGFFSDYNGNPNPGPGLPILWDQGTYQIGSNANTFHYGFQGFDHTLPFFGSFMVINGANIIGSNIWCQTVTVVPGGTYNFSTWLCSVSTDNPALLQFTINGINVGNPFSAPPNLNNWQQHSSSWTAPAGLTTATICITNITIQGGGNDFGLDDISFTGCAPVDVVNVANAGPDISACSGETINIGEASSPNINYNWATNPYFNNLTNSSPTFTINNNGPVPLSYTFTLTSDSLNLGCTTTDQVVVTINPLPTHTLPASVQVCELPVTIDAGNGGTDYLWNTGANTPSIEVTTAGSYNVTVSLGNCSVTANASVGLIPFQSADLGPDLLVCSLPIEISANINNANYLWNNGSTNQTIEINGAGIYSLLLTDNGCESYDEIEVTFDQVYDFTLQSVLEVCTFPYQFESNVNADTYNWSNGGNQSNVTFSAPGTYSLVAFEGECSGSRNIEVIQIPYLAVNLPDTIIVCELPAEISTNIPNADSYAWSNGSQSNSSIIESSGDYIVTIIDNSCPTTDVTYVYYLPQPEIILSKYQSVLCEGDVDLIRASLSNFDSYYWENGQESAEILVSVTGIETIYAENYCGSTQASVEVIVNDCQHNLFIPNAFTPNGDGVNDLFEIITYNFLKAEIWIYNRYGEEVFYSDEILKKWNGAGMQGDYYSHPEVFAYRFLGKTILGETIEKNGHVTLIR
jgi:gliding motility-associated-like protein